MTLEVLLFARARDLAGAGSLRVEVPDDATISQVRESLAAKCPRLGDLLPRCTLAVDGEFASDHDTIAAGAEVAVLPPVSGG